MEWYHWIVKVNSSVNDRGMLQQLWQPVFSWKPGECSEFYIHVAALIDNNNDTFPNENLWNIQVKQYLCSLESDKRSETNENYNKCFIWV